MSSSISSKQQSKNKTTEVQNLTGRTKNTRLVKRMQIVALITSLLIGSLIIVASFILQDFISQQQNDATVISILGRQAMLSQHIAKHSVYMTITRGKKQVHHINPLNESIALFKESHQNLTKKSNTLGLSASYELSQKTQNLYDSLEPFYQGLTKGVDDLLVSNIILDSAKRVEKLNFNFEKIERNERAFLPIMNAIIFAYDTERSEKATHLRFIQIGITLLIIFLAVILTFFGLRPLVNKVKQALFDVEKINTKLITQNKKLKISEEEVQKNAEELSVINNNLEVSERTLKTYINQIEEVKKIAKLAAYDFDVVTGKIIPTEHLNYILGLDKEIEITDELMAEYIHPEDKKMVFDKRQDAITSRKDSFYRFRLKTTQFEDWHWFQGVTHVVLDENKKIDYVINVLQDITENVRKEDEIKKLLIISQEKQIELTSSEEELRQNSEELQNINDSLFVAQRETEEKQQLLNHAEEIAQMGSFNLDLETNNYSYSENLTVIFGLDASKMTSPKRHLKYIHQDEKETIEKLFMELMQGKRDNLSETIHFKGNKHDDWRFLKLDFYLLRNFNSSPSRILGVIQDVTETEINKKLVEKSQKQLQSLSDNLQGVMFRAQINSAWTMDFISSGVEKLTGYPAESFVVGGDRSFADSIYEKDKFIDEDIVKAIKNHDSYKIEYRFSHKNKNIIWVEETGTPIFNEKGEAIYIDGVIMDISARKQTEELIKAQNKKLLLSQNQLQEQQLLLQDAEKMAKMGSYIWEIKTNTIRHSENLPVIYDFPTDKIITREVFAQITHPEDWEKNRIALEKVLNKQEDSLFVTYRARPNKNQEWKYYESFAFLKYNENTEISTLIGTVQDVTTEVLKNQEMEQLLDEISKNKNYLDEAQNLAKIVSYEMDIYSKKIKWSDSFANVFNTSPEVIPNNADDFQSWIGEEYLEKANEGWAKAIATKTEFNEVYCINSPKGVKFYVRERGYPVFGLNGSLTSMRGTLQDITKSEIAKKEIEKKSVQIEKQNVKFIGSVNYAQRIQSAMLGGTQELKSIFKDAFIFFEPKDIVSGDFYWYTQLEEHKKIAIIGDCTGHGVPGAFMSLLGTTILNQIILQQKITTPSLILDALQKEIKKTLNQENTGNKDGMDIAVVVIDYSIKTIEFAGAKNPLVYVHKNRIKGGADTNLTVIKGDNLSIGGRKTKTESAVYTNHIVSLENIEAFYLYSDGYQDQFGGEYGGKFMSNKFRQLLYDTHSTSMRHQRVSLKRTLMNWMGTENDQIDDICVMGVTI